MTRHGYFVMLSYNQLYAILHRLYDWGDISKLINDALCFYEVALNYCLLLSSVKSLGDPDVHRLKMS